MSATNEHLEICFRLSSSLRAWSAGFAAIPMACTHPMSVGFLGRAVANPASRMPNSYGYHEFRSC